MASFCRGEKVAGEKCSRGSTRMALRPGLAHEAITADVAAGVTVLRVRARLTASRYSTLSSTTAVRGRVHGQRHRVAVPTPYREAVGGGALKARAFAYK